jgi:hypothetical protein
MDEVLNRRNIVVFMAIGLLLSAPGCETTYYDEWIEHHGEGIDSCLPSSQEPSHHCGEDQVQDSGIDQCLREVVTLRPDRAVAFEHLGFAVAATADSVAVGAKDSNRSGLSQSGAVLVFARRDGIWRYSNVFTSHGAEAGDNFGFAVAISDTALVVGAPFSSASGVQAGAVYVYDKTIDGRWTEPTILSPPEGRAFDIFGYSVAIDGERIAIGALQVGDEQQGAAFIYERDRYSWQLVATFHASDGTPYAKFGSSVAISGNRVLVGAISDSHLAIAAGSAYVFEQDAQGWSEKFKLIAEDSARADFFGFSLALFQDTAVIGTYLKNLIGAAYVFKNTGRGWVQQQKIVPADAMPGDAFGTSISLLGNDMAIGSPHNDGAAPNAGAIYLFREVNGRWKPLDKLYRETPHDNDEYGRAVMLSQGGFVATGAWLAGASEPEAGTVEIACPQR